MNCKKVRRYLPLYIESDLPAKKKEKIRIHLESCVDCQREHEAFALSSKKAKELLDEGAISWTNADWKRTIEYATSYISKTPAMFAPWPFKKGWAFAVMGALMVVLIFFVTRPLFLGVDDFPGGAILAKQHSQHQKGTANKSPQDVVSMTMVSKETGLKVVWILNKNFNLEENK